MDNPGKPKTGTASAPTLVKKQVSEFSVTPDVQRIMGMKADPKGFNPEITPPITDPAARSYAARVQERMVSKKDASSLKGKAPPLGHVEPPPSEKMEAIAALSSGMVQPVFAEPPPPPSPASPPEEKQPPPIKGVGAAYPVNQALARGEFDRPVSLKEGNQMTKQGGLSPESMRALELAKENSDKEQKTAPEPEKPPAVAKETKKDLDDVEQDLPNPLGQLDLTSITDIRANMMSKERQESIEKRLTPLNIGEMVTKRELTQTVPIVPGKLEVTLRTFTQKENLWVLKYIFDYPGSSLYVQELLNTCRLVCGLVAINGAYLPDHRKNLGQPDEVITKEDFEKKFHHVVSFPVQLVADFSVQSIWFQERVDKLFTVDALKNG